MHIDSASRKLQTESDLPVYVPGKGIQKTYALGDNHGTFSGLYQGDLSAAQYQRRIGTQDVQQHSQLQQNRNSGLIQQNSYHQSISSKRNLT